MLNKLALLAGTGMLLLMATFTKAQISDGGTPPGAWANGKLPSPQRILLPPVNVQEVEIQERLLDKQGVIRPYRIGVPVPVKINAEEQGTWTTLPDGDRVWRLTITSPGATNIMMAFTRFLIPDGAMLFVYNRERDYYIGGFTNRNQQPGLNLGIQPVWGDEVTLEYYEPSGADFKGQLAIGTVVHGYKSADAIKGFGTSGACNRNVSCPEGTRWRDQINSVAMIADAQGGGLCSGSMVVSTDSSGKNYFLTANHCTSGATVANWVFWFNWQSPTCNNPAADPRNQQTVSGATLKARSGTSDFALLELTTRPPNNYNVYLNGWNRSYARPMKGFGIHHPDGDIKKFSTYNGRLTPVQNYGGTRASVWRVVWSTATTEGGSSGSPIFDSLGLVVGQLYGGGASCTNLTSPDNYGRFSSSWDTNAAASAQLKTWLDPNAIAGLQQRGVYQKCLPLARTLPVNETFTTVGTALPANWEVSSATTVNFVKIANLNAFGGAGACAGIRPIVSGNRVVGSSTLKTAPFNLKNVNSLLLKWDYAGSHVNGTKDDTLEILYSTDCGTTFTSLGTRIGAQLNTSSNPADTAFTPTQNQWAKDSIALPLSVENQRFVQFAFVYKRDTNTNSFYLDNVMLKGQAVAVRPRASYTVNSSSICAGGQVTFTNTSVNSPTSQTWYFDGGTPATASTPTATVTYAAAGIYSVKLVVRNSAGADSVTTNTAIEVKVVDQYAVPYVQTFGGAAFPPVGWSRINNTNGDSTWNRAWQIKEGTNPVVVLPDTCAYINNYPTDNKGSVDYLVTPGFNALGRRNLWLTFKYAYKYYGPSNIDTLAVAYSKDCGLSWNTLFEASGTNLATVTGTGTAWFIPTSMADFKDQTIQLPAAALQSDNLKFAFINKGGYGQLLYINTVSVDTAAPVGIPIAQKLAESVRLYPNPNQGKFQIDLPGSVFNGNVVLTLTNSLGQLVWQANTSLQTTGSDYNSAEINIANLPKGLYYLTAMQGAQKVVKAVSIR